MTTDTSPAGPAPLAADALAAAVGAAVERFRNDADAGALVGAVHALAKDATDAAALAAAARPHRQIPEAAVPLYERLVTLAPDDADALVGLANAYWLTGRGADAVGALASRAIAADPANRAGWHLWALSESNPRARTDRWRQVSQRFPHDDLAKAAFADNAASLAGAEHDPVALGLAIAAYEELLAAATHPQQREALGRAVTTLKGWRL